MSTWYTALCIALNPFLTAAAPLVEYISISYYRPTSPDLPDLAVYCRRPIFRGGTPSLGEIKLENLHLVNCGPPLKSVTHLTLSMGIDDELILDLTTWGSFSKELTSLVYLHLEGMVVNDYPYHDPPISIPSLRQLHILSNDSSGLDTCIRSFHLPGLESLFLCEAYATFEFLRTVLDSGVPKFPPVQELHLEAYSGTVHLSHGLAYNFPNLRSLTLHHGNIHLSPQVAFLRDNVDCFPLLEDLDLRRGPQDNDLLLSMLQKRVESGHPIRSCAFARTRGIREQINYLNDNLPLHYELDRLRPALNYIA